MHDVRGRREDPGRERIILGREPREAWLFTQPFCDVCTTVHALASVRAVEDALDLEIPLNAQYIRNLILIAHAVHDHVVHFYQPAQVGPLANVLVGYAQGNPRAWPARSTPSTPPAATSQR